MEKTYSGERSRPDSGVSHVLDKLKYGKSAATVESIARVCGWETADAIFKSLVKNEKPYGNAREKIENVWWTLLYFSGGSDERQRLTDTYAGLLTKPNGYLLAEDKGVPAHHDAILQMPDKTRRSFLKAIVETGWVEELCKPAVTDLLASLEPDMASKCLNRLSMALSSERKEFKGHSWREKKTDNQYYRMLSEYSGDAAVPAFKLLERPGVIKAMDAPEEERIFQIIALSVIRAEARS